MLLLCRQKGEINVAHGGAIKAGILSQGHDNLTAMKEHSRYDKISLLRIHSISMMTEASSILCLCSVSRIV
jgi:hypothetical protein